MKLELSQIREITKGAVRVEEENGIIRFYRFTKEQELLYKERSDDFYKKTFACAGIKLLFKTNSRNLFLKVNMASGSSRTYFSFDVFVNGKATDYLDNFSDVELPENYATIPLELGEFSENFVLGEGEKEVCVYLPWSMQVQLLEMSIDEGAFVEKIPTEKKLLAFGDSITQGYDALRPSMRYIGRLAQYLEAEEINKAIGGERFFPTLAETEEPFMPDYITVAYGSNDWNRITRDEFVEKCEAFYGALSAKYPNAQIFAITPIWRKDYQGERSFGDFHDVEKEIGNAVANLDNVTLIPGFHFVPKEESYFADLRLHPNDKGFDCYFNNLSAEFAKLLRKE